MTDISKLDDLFASMHKAKRAYFDALPKITADELVALDGDSDRFINNTFYHMSGIYLQKIGWSDTDENDESNVRLILLDDGGSQVSYVVVSRDAVIGEHPHA